MNIQGTTYGVLIDNELLKSLNKPQEQRTALLGQIFRIENVLGSGNIAVRYLQEGDSWETTTYCCPQKSVVTVHEKLWPFLSAVTSPQERVKLAKDKQKCEKLLALGKDFVVGFTDTNDILLGHIRHIGMVKGIGQCFGIELHQKKNNNFCYGSYAGIQYFKCKPGYGLFTTIEKIAPLLTIASRSSPPPTNDETDIDICVRKNFVSLDNDTKPKNESIVTTYREYSGKKSSAPLRNSSYFRNSQSLQNMLDLDTTSVNTNNDFDQNTVIQADQSYLIHNNDVQKKGRVKSQVDLIDVIGGSWSGTSDKKELESFSNLKKTLDRNDKNCQTDHTVTIRSGRNKSMNPLNHLLDGHSTTGRRSKFYTSDIVVNNHKEENGKKINEKNEQLAKATSTFYVNDKPKYHDPQPGTTNDLTIGSLVEVYTQVSDDLLYGVVRWMGVKNDSNFVLVGVELEDDQSHLPLDLTDGTHNGDRYFKCPEGKAFFVPLDQCHKDTRFQDGVTPTPVHSASENVMECSSIPGAVKPLCMPTEEDVEAVCGKFRGIQGHHNSCYLDVSLFSMFTYTGVFDSVLFRPKNANDIPDYEEVQRVLREEIVNPLRKNLFVSADHVMKLRKLLDKLSSVSGLTSEEKDPEEFLNSLLAQILKAEPFLKLNSGQEAFHYQLFVEKNANLSLPTVQQLFEQSFWTSNVKLKEVPSCLIIQMPRFGKTYKMYPRILPSLLLDVTDIIEGSPRQCTVCGKLAKWECRECFDNSANAGLENTAFCQDCLHTAHRNEKRRHHQPTKLEVSKDFSILENHCQPPRLFMELFAVICIETSHYVAFVKCDVGPEAPWCFFDSMADRQGEKNGFNIPEMVACPEIAGWLSDEGNGRHLHERFPDDRLLPEYARRLLCDAYICMYQSSDVMMYR